jgi:dephospho-CoA kinase
MLIVGLTGSIGMGKSETANMFREASVPVFDADAAVHALQAKDGRALQAIEEAFPGVIENGVLNRAKLGSIVFADADARKKLEAIMHPMVADERIAFFKDTEKAGNPFVVLDIPLLYETKGDKGCHKVVVVSAPAEVQRVRVLARPGMTEEKFEQILAKQTPDADKRAKADYIVETDKGLDHARGQVTRIIKDLREQAANA